MPGHNHVRRRLAFFHFNQRDLVAAFESEIKRLQFVLAQLAEQSKMLRAIRLSLKN